MIPRILVGIRKGSFLVEKIGGRWTPRFSCHAGAFGTTTGNLDVSEDGGEQWATVANNLPPIYSVRFG